MRVKYAGLYIALLFSAAFSLLCFIPNFNSHSQYIENYYHKEILGKLTLAHSREILEWNENDQSAPLVTGFLKF